MVWVCMLVQYAKWNRLPSSLESHVQHITLFAFRKCSAQCHLNTFWWVETDRRFLTLHRVGVQLFIMHMYVCACVGVWVCGCGWQKSWHSGIWKRWLSLQTNSWSGGLIGRRISTPLCLRLIAIWLQIKLCKLEVNRYLVTGVEIADNLFLIFTQDSKTSYLKTVWENHNTRKVSFFFSSHDQKLLKDTPSYLN